MEFKIDMAVVELSAQEREEIIRERVRQMDEERQRAANAKGFFARAGYRFTKEMRKARDLMELKDKTDNELFAGSSEEFKKRKALRAEEIAQLGSDSLFNELSDTKGFRESLGGSLKGSNKITMEDVRTNSANYQKFLAANPTFTPEQAKNYFTQREALTSHIKDFAKDLAEAAASGKSPKLTREAFERTKKEILGRMLKDNPDALKAVESEFDNAWVKVEQLAKRVEHLGNASDVIDAMNIDFNIKFGRARLNHETQDTLSTSIRMENAIMNSKILSYLPFEKKYYALGAIMTAASWGSGSLSRVGKYVPFLGPLVSGVVSGGMEYARKRDEVTYTQGRITRLLAEGKDISEIMRSQNPKEIAKNVSVQKTEDIMNRINSSYDAYAAATDKDAAMRTLIGEIAGYRALLETSTKEGVDLVGSSSQEKLIADKAELSARCNQILEQLQTNHPKVDLKTIYLESAKSRIDSERKLLDERTRQANALRRGLALGSATRVGLTVAAGSLIGSEIRGLFSHNTQSLGEYALGIDTESSKQTSLTWLAKWMRGDEAGLHEMVRTPGVLRPESHFDANAIRGTETVMQESTLSSEQVEEALTKKSTFISELSRTYTGTAEAQINKYGGLTRSMWESDNSSTLEIWGRDQIGEKAVLHDFNQGYLEAFKNGTFRAIVNLPEGKTVDVTNLIKLEGGRPVIDFSKEPGIIGEMFKNGSSEGLKYIENIQYGIGSGNNIDIVSTIDGGGQNFIPNPETISTPVENVVRGKWVEEMVQAPDTFELGDLKENEDLYLFYFGNMGRNNILEQKKKKETATSTTTTPEAAATTTPGATATLASERATPVTSPEAAATTETEKDTEKLVEVFDSLIKALKEPSAAKPSEIKKILENAIVEISKLKIDKELKDDLIATLTYYKNRKFSMSDADAKEKDIISLKKNLEGELKDALGTKIADKTTESFESLKKPSKDDIEEASKKLSPSDALELFKLFFFSKPANFKEEVALIKKMTGIIEGTKTPRTTTPEAEGTTSAAA